MVDVFIVGGGPAGLAAAIAARRKGFSVTLADALPPPIDKACGEGLMPDALETAHELGIALPAAEGFGFRGIRFIGEGVSTDADFPNGAGLGLRRTVLHQALCDEAERSGVDLRWGTTISSLDSICARYVIGADGLRSRVRAWAGLDHGSRESQRFGFRTHYRVEPWSEYVEIYWGSGFQVYITPIAPEEVCVALISRDPHFRLEHALPRLPELRKRLGSAEPIDTARGAPSISRRLKHVTRGSVALIGDASGSVDAITGEGMNLAFQQARALADALERENLAEYAAAHRCLAHRARLMSGALLSLDRLPAVRQPVLKVFAARPQIFSRLLAFHVGSSGARPNNSLLDPAGVSH